MTTPPDPRSAHAKLLRSLGHDEAATIVEVLDGALEKPEAKPEQPQPAPAGVGDQRQREGQQLLAQLNADLGNRWGGLPLTEEPPR